MSTRTTRRTGTAIVSPLRAAIGPAFRAAVSLAAVISIVPAASAQDEWTTFTPKNEVRSVIETKGVLWAATSGGLFSRAAGSIDSIEEYTTSEGLRTIDLTALAADSAGDLYVGAFDGTVHRFTPARDRWAYIMDIAILDAAQKRINRLSVSGDTLFVMSDVGLSVYSISRSEFGDTYMRFGSGSGQIDGGVTSAVVARGELWVGTRSGAASAPLSAPNLTDPASWRTWRAADGLPSDVVTALLASGDTVYAGTRAGIAMNAAGAPAAWSVVPGSAGLDVVAMEAAAPPCGGGFFVTPSLLGVIGAGAASVVDTMPGFIPAAAAPGSGSSVWIGSTLSGAYAYDLCGQASPDTLFSVLPAGPPSRRFISVEVDANGWIWSATGSRNGEGFMRYDGSGWRSYTVASDPRLGINEYYTMSVGPDNVKYAGSWGAGLAVLTPDGEIDTVYNTANGFPSSVLAEPFVVVGGVAVDQAGAAWVTTRTPPPDTSLTLLPAGGGIGYLHGCGAGCTMRTPNNVFNDVVIDFNGTKWFTNFSRFEPEPAVGFYYYNESFDLPGTSQGWGRLTTADGLTSLQVWSAAIDLFGDLWIGSERGITIIYNTADPRRSAAVYHPLPDQVIQDILVDPLNRKWVATKRGVFLLSTDGTSIVENFTVASTGGRLLDDDVASLAMDRDGGVVWFGTEKGLSGVRTAAIAPVRAYGELLIYPNPFVLPAAAPVTIDGLVSGSSLKLFSIDGALVRELGTPGGRIGFWDGRDEAGNDVGTGVYLVVAYEENGTETARGKIAVVRK